MTITQPSRATHGVTLSACALLFDMDGTLVDSSAIIERTWRWWSDRHGLPVEPILAVQLGRPNSEVLREFAPPGLDLAAEARAFLITEQADQTGLRQVPGAAEAVAAAQAGRWAVVTSAEQSLARARLQAAGLPLPPVLVSADRIQRGKPDPQCYLLAAQLLGVSPDGCLVFEDAPAGVEAGRAAGMRVVGLLTSLAAHQLPASWHVRDFCAVRISPREDRCFDVSLSPAAAA